MTPKQLISSIENLKIKQYIVDEIDICYQQRVRLKINKNKPLTINGTEVNGYFQDEPFAQLAIKLSENIEDWLAVFIHETSHRDQWIEQDPTWTVVIKDYFDANDILDMWVHGAVELNSQQINEVTQQIVLNELDCERRSLQKIKTYNLPIDKETYAQKANAYVYYYHAIAHTRRYTEVDAPYMIDQLWQAMPKNLDQNYNSIDPVLLDLYMQHCY